MTIGNKLKHSKVTISKILKSLLKKKVGLQVNFRYYLIQK